MPNDIIGPNSVASNTYRFITQVKTPTNPKDLLHINEEEFIRTYLAASLVGAFLVFLMVVY